METLVADKRLLGVRRRSELAGEETEGDVIRADTAGVVHINRNAFESALVFVSLIAVGGQSGDIVARGGHGADVGGEVGVVHSVAELEDGGTVVPFVGSAWRASSLVRAKSHVGHGDVGNVVGRVLGDGKTSSRSSLSGDDVEQSNTTILTRVTTPQQSRDVGVLEKRSVVELVTHLSNDGGLAVACELTDSIELSSCPVDGLAIHTFSFDTDIQTASIDDDISLLSSSPHGEPVVGSRIALATRSSSIEDLSTRLLSSVQGAVKVRRNTEVVTDHLLSGIGPVSNDSDLSAVGDSERKKTVILEQNDTLFSSSKSDLLSVRSADIGESQVSVHGVGTIKVASADERSVQTEQGLVYSSLVDETLAVSLGKVMLVVSTAVEVSTRIECSRCSALAGVAEVVRQVNVLDRITITGDPLLLVGPAPVLAKNIIQKPRIGASRDTVQGTVSAHESSYVGVSGARTERRQVVLDKITLADLNIVLVAEVAIP